MVMKVTLIGAGNLATNLGKALFKAGHDIVEVYSRTMSSAEPLAHQLNAQAITDLQKVNAHSDVYIIAVKDSVLDEVIAGLQRSEEQGALSKKTVYIHTAGSISMNVFNGRFAHYGVLYPMQTFSKDREVAFKDIPIFVEGSDDDSLSVSKQLAESVSEHVQECTSQQRKQLHLAAVFACNFVNHCYALSAELLERQGLSFDVMLPLIDETARKVHQIAPRQAQTGPALRYDENVIGMQSAMLNDLPLVKEIYEKMSRSIHSLQHT